MAAVPLVHPPAAPASKALAGLRGAVPPSLLAPVLALALTSPGLAH
ncbi:MAG TPA: hypothetical protein VFY87_00655 [Geminicoccaceae bacterium]|nr:hypothetical protein [Geminicoccaceae bacterium]